MKVIRVKIGPLGSGMDFGYLIRGPFPHATY